MMKKLLNATLLLIMILALATPVLAQEGNEQPGQVIFGSNRELQAGDIINGDMVIFGGNLGMADGSRIEGDAVIFGGSGEINGEITGDLAVIGGNVRLGPTARVEGDVAAIGGQADRDESAYVGGDLIETTELDLSRIPVPPFRAVPPRPDFGRDFGVRPLDQFFRMMLGFAQGLIVALVVSAVGLLVALFLPEHSQTVGSTIRQAAPASFGVGLLTLIVGAAAITVLFVTCCLAPVGLLAVLVLVLATLYGWIVVGYLLGQRMLRAIQKDNEPTPAASALVGIFTVTLAQQWLTVLGGMPCLGFVFWLLGAGLWLVVASTGLGAVVLTRFGTQPYTGTSATRRPLPPLPPMPPLPPSEPAGPEVPGETKPESKTVPSKPQASPESQPAEPDSTTTETS
jgi:hypothetical protein